MVSISFASHVNRGGGIAQCFSKSIKNTMIGDGVQSYPPGGLSLWICCAQQSPQSCWIPTSPPMIQFQMLLGKPIADAVLLPDS